MAVPEPQRKQGEFTLITKARELAAYTGKITRNQNVFLPEYNDAITNQIVHLANSIYLKCRRANKIRVNNTDKYERRFRLQNEAWEECNDLIGLIQLAQRELHFTTKRLKYWSGNIIEVRNMIQSWAQADMKRYKQYRQ